MKKIISIVATVFLVLTTCITTFAATTGTITIKNDPTVTGISVKSDTFSAFKILDLDPTQTYKYKLDADYKNFFTSKVTPSDDVSTDEKFNSFAVNYVRNNKDIDVLARELRAYTIANNIKEEGKNGQVNVAADKKESTDITSVALGYYIIFDTKAPQSTVVAAAALGTTDTNLVINLKAGAPTIDKQIKHNESGSWGIVGDNQIGDKVEYRIIGKVPSSVQAYTKYNYVIHDTLDKGLTFNNDITVYVGDKDNGGRQLTKYFTLPQVTDGHSFDVKVDILGGLGKPDGFNLSDKLYVYYTATLNENALVASDHNDNKAYLEYSNNPYDENDTDELPEIKVKDYTFKLKVLKTGEDGKTPLPGAKFTLSAKGKNISFIKTILFPGTPNETNQYVVSTGQVSGTPTEEIISGTKGNFEIVGLDDEVEYTLTETEAPKGYNTIAPIKFIIKAVYDNNGDVTSVTTNVTDIKVIPGTFVLGTTVVDTLSTKLPETGGMGTTIFMVVGGTLMVATIGLVIVKRRKKTA